MEISQHSIIQIEKKKKVPVFFWHKIKTIPKKNLGIDFPHSAGLPPFLDLCVIPVPTLLGVIWIVVDHDDHSGLQLVPLVYCTSPGTNILAKQLDHSILWVAVIICDTTRVWISEASPQVCYHVPKIAHKKMREYFCIPKFFLMCFKFFLNSTLMNSNQVKLPVWLNYTQHSSLRC